MTPYNQNGNEKAQHGNERAERGQRQTAIPRAPGHSGEPSKRDRNRGRDIGIYSGAEYPANDRSRGENIGVYSGNEYPPRNPNRPPEGLPEQAGYEGEDTESVDPD